MIDTVRVKRLKRRIPKRIKNLDFVLEHFVLEFKDGTLRDAFELYCPAKLVRLPLVPHIRGKAEFIEGDVRTGTYGYELEQYNEMIDLYSGELLDKAK